MKHLIFSFALLAIILSSSCKVIDCPPDEKIGSVDLSDTTKRFIPSFYIDEASLIFKNGNEAQIKLALTEQVQQVDQLCIETICNEPEFDGKNTCKYFDASSHRFTYANDDSSILMDLLFSIGLARQGTEYFFDIMSIGMSSPDNLFTFSQHITDVRFYHPSISAPPAFKPMVFMAEFQLLDTTFTNVYANENDKLKTYYTQESGLVGFDLDGEIWRFVGME